MSWLYRDLLTAMIFISALAHGALLAFASWAGMANDTLPRLVPVQPGRFSVALQAQVAEAPEPQPVLDEVVERQQVLTVPPETPSPVELPVPPPELPREQEKKPDEQPKVKPTERPAPQVVKPSAGARASQGAVFDDAPDYYYNPSPHYPADALARKLDGYVVVHALVDASGRVQTVRIAQSSGLASFDESALAAVKTWVFYPARRRGQPIALEVEVPVRFEIREQQRR